MSLPEPSAQPPSYEELVAENAILRQRVAELEAVVAELREMNAVLVARVKELEDQLGKDSYNSSKPPSSDMFGRKRKSLREKSDKATGGQKGHKGNRLEMVTESTRWLHEVHVYHRIGRISRTAAKEGTMPERVKVDGAAVGEEVSAHGGHT